MRKLPLRRIPSLASPFDLSDRIHQFHSGRSRELFNAYSSSLQDLWIAHAVAGGVIDESELSENLRTELSEDIAVFRERWQASDRSADSD